MRSLTLLVVFFAMSILACGGETTEPQPVASVVLTPGTTLLVSLGETAQITAAAQDAAGGDISGKTFAST